MMHANANPTCAAMWLLLALSLTGCATPSTPSAPSSPTLPPPPSLSQPIPQQSYSERARTNIEAWQRRLTDTRLISEPSLKPGQ